VGDLVFSRFTRPHPRPRALAPGAPRRAGSAPSSHHAVVITNLVDLNGHTRTFAGHTITRVGHTHTCAGHRWFCTRRCAVPRVSSARPRRGRRPTTRAALGTYSLHPTTYTLNTLQPTPSTPYNLHPQHPTPYTYPLDPHPTPFTLHPSPSTLSTRKPFHMKAGTCRRARG